MKAFFLIYVVGPWLTQYRCKHPQIKARPSCNQTRFIKTQCAGAAEPTQRKCLKYYWTASFCMCLHVHELVNVHLCWLAQARKPKQTCVHASYKQFNLSDGSERATPPWCHTDTPSFSLSGRQDRSELIKDNEQNKPLGESIPHLTAPGWRRRAFNSLLHNYSFDVDGTLRMKGEQTPMCRH